MDILVAALRAAGLGVLKHDGQVRKGSQAPYVVHPLRVAEKIAAAPDLPKYANRDVAILAALLHDTLEDTDVEPDALADRFGPNVLAVVQELTQDKSLAKPERRQQMLEHSKTYSVEAKVVKLADRWDNMSEMDTMGREFQLRYCREARTLLTNIGPIWPTAEAAIRELIHRYEGEH